MFIVLIDTTGIQEYVFGSNKVAENLGASYNVKNLYECEEEGLLREVSHKLFSNRVELEKWKTEPDNILIKSGKLDMEVGYIGGGNALLLFKDKDCVRRFIEEWTKTLLIETPGLNTAVATQENVELDNISMSDLFKDLSKNKFTFHPIVTLPRHGITAECTKTGLSTEFYQPDKDGKEQYISSVAHSKLENESKAHTMFSKEFGGVLEKRDGDKVIKYRFPKKLEDLGQDEGKNHIAVVHIDGNDIGELFSECKTIEALRELSDSLKEAVKESAKKLVTSIVENYEDYYEKGFRLKDKTLPIRPIILGGDDITFACEGRLGVHFAETFIKAFTSVKLPGDKTLSACGGIAITKTKYPFYRGYKLAEELCHSAKIKAKDKGEENSSWLDFHIAYGGLSGNLSSIRERNYITSEGTLYFRPYRLHGRKSDEYNFIECGKAIKKLSEWPNNKLAEFREALTRGETATKKFIIEMGYRKRELGGSYCDYNKSGWKDSKTPYFDVIELMDFYLEDMKKHEITKA